MKRFLLAFLATATLFACTKGDDGGDVSQTKISLNISSLDLTHERGSFVVTFTTSSTWLAFSGEDWIQIEPTHGKAGENSITINVKPNTDLPDREAKVTIKSGECKEYITVFQNGTQDIVARDREALIDLYKALDGDNWKNNENWCSDKPLSDWYGVDTSMGIVSSLDLHSNNLQGCIPESIENLKNLSSLYLYDNNIHGSIPECIGNLAKLEYLNLAMNNISGEIPTQICQLTNLTSLALYNNHLSGDIPNNIGNLTNLTSLTIGNNMLTGCIPENIGSLINLEHLDLSYNRLSGSIPANLSNLTKIPPVDSRGHLLYLTLYDNNFSDVDKKFQQSTLWANYWGAIVPFTALHMQDLHIPAPKFNNITTINGDNINDDIYSTNELTLLFEWPINDLLTPQYLTFVQDIYLQYRDKNVDVISYTNSDDIESVKSLLKQHNIEWDTFCQNNNDFQFWAAGFYPLIHVIDKNKKVVFTSAMKDYTLLPQFLNDYFNDKDITLYKSSDYSKDGEIITLQTATQGNGIDIVLMGDAYSDRQIANGYYKDIMEKLYTNFFTEEPYKSFKDYFNVYYVNVVSENEGYGLYNKPALSGFFGAGSYVKGNNAKVFSYAEKAISSERMDEALIIVAMNSDRDAGTCWMYNPSTTGDWGNGVSISYFPTGQDDTALAHFLHHEACGHGFAKLADEYHYEVDGSVILEETVLDYKTQQTNWGWWKNVDFTSDPIKVRWNYFLTDTRYANDGLGVYEGGLGAWKGVWRPTENSIMRYITGGFNAPSREAIYYRIHKLAYGADWQYDYEKFVEWDAKNRKDAAATRAIPYRHAEIKPTHPPVVINKSWKDAK